MSIPKILHFTWKTADVPGEMGVYLKRWRDLHPDWDIRLWTDATMQDFVRTTYPDLVSVYEGYTRNIQRADSFRYLVLNALGGVYADLDVEPFRAIDTLVEGLTCFAGIEPDEHMGRNTRHTGAPFLVTNAFMGGVPGHPWFRELVRLLPMLAGSPTVFLSTGPSVTTGASLRLRREDRPVLVLPAQWSPTIDGGAACTSDATLRALLSEAFDFVERPGDYVAHRWMSTWVPWDKRHKHLAKPLHAFHALKWMLRQQVHRDLAEVAIEDQLEPYFDQYPKPPEAWPRVAICVVSETGVAPLQVLSAALAGLDYPPELLSIETCPKQDEPASTETDTHAHLRRWAALANRHVETADAEAEWLLFVDEAVTAIPSDALKAMLSADRPVVALGASKGTNAVADRSVFRYTEGGFRTAYKIRGKDGLASPERGRRMFLPELAAFAAVPLDGAGHSFILARRDVLDAGVRFATDPYHLHLGGEAFALMARHRGFEVAGLTLYSVETAR